MCSENRLKSQRDLLKKTKEIPKPHSIKKLMNKINKKILMKLN